VLVEYARNVLGVEKAEHAETSPDAERLVVTALSCSLVGQQHRVRILPGTRAAELYGRDEAVERYYCNYGLNPEYRPALEASGLRVSAEDEEDGEVRIVELDGHPFFLGTLFLPQMTSSEDDPHPILIGLADALTATAPGGASPVSSGP
jgi:CTP synthase (UTP-ammonia lyase)